MREAAEKIRQEISTRMLAESLGVHVDRRGEALCPFHGDTNKSLHIYADPKRGWMCFGCHRGGTVIDFAMHWYGITFRQAVVRLDADFNLGLPLGRKATPQEKRRMQIERERKKKEKQDRMNAVKSTEDLFWAAHARYMGLLNLIDDTRPKRAENEISDLYASALHLLPAIREDFHQAEYALENARKEAEGNGSKSTAA